METTCNNPNFCQYKVMGPVGFECQYQGYCDYKAPRDSRNIGLLPKDKE